MKIQRDPVTGDVTLVMDKDEAWGVGAALLYLSSASGSWEDAYYDRRAGEVPPGIDLDKALDAASELGFTLNNS